MADAFAGIVAVLTALQVPITAGIFGLFGVWLTTRISRSQLEVSRQTLFVSMLPRRIAWIDSFNLAIADWDRQMQTIIHYEGNDPPEPTALFELNRLTQESHWLFGPKVTTITSEIDQQFEIVRNLRIGAKHGADRSEAAQRVGPAILKIYELAGKLNGSAKPSLFVGDIERPSSVVKALPPLQGIIGVSSAGSTP